MSIKKIKVVLLFILMLASFMLTSCGDSEGPRVSGVKLDKSEYIFTDYADSLQLVATIEPANAGNLNLVWETDSIEVAFVDENGLVSPRNNGIAVITVTTQDGNFKANCVITVDIPAPPPPREINVESIEIVEKMVSLEVGDEYKLVVLIQPFSAENSKIIWESSDETIAKVSNEDETMGIVTALKKGEVSITARADDTVNGELVDVCSIIVSAKNTGGSSSSGSGTGIKLPSVPKPVVDSQHYLISDNLPAFNAVNSDCIAWLYIPGTNINFAVAMDSSNKYYLERGLDKKYKFNGSAFMNWKNSDVKNTGKFTDYDNYSIFGHAKGDDIFDRLGRGTRLDTWFNVKDNHYICLNTLTTETVWRVYATYYTQTSSTRFVQEEWNLSQEAINKKVTEAIKGGSKESVTDLMSKFKRDETAFMAYATGWKARVDTTSKNKEFAYLRDRDFGVTVKPTDTILTISTCADVDGELKYVMHAVLVSERPRTGR